MTNLATSLSPSVAPPVLADTSVYVPPGRVVVAADGASLVTVVGSGVAVCVWDAIRGVGGMAHFLLPEAGSAAPAPRYGNVAVRSLLDELGRLCGGNGRGLRAAVYGGSAPPITSDSGHLGDRNVEAAFGLLAASGVLVMERDVGGEGARKVVFSPRQGRAEVSKVGA
jgi:chemotaxis protein CheD